MRGQLTGLIANRGCWSNFWYKQSGHYLYSPLGQDCFEEQWWTSLALIIYDRISILSIAVSLRIRLRIESICTKSSNRYFYFSLVSYYGSTLVDLGFICCDLAHLLNDQRSELKSKNLLNYYLWYRYFRRYEAHPPKKLFTETWKPRMHGQFHRKVRPKITISKWMCSAYIPKGSPKIIPRNPFVKSAETFTETSSAHLPKLGVNNSPNDYSPKISNF